MTSSEYVCLASAPVDHDTVGGEEIVTEEPLYLAADVLACCIQYRLHSCWRIEHLTCDAILGPSTDAHR